MKIVVYKSKEHFLGVAADATCCQISFILTQALGKQQKASRQHYREISGASVMGGLLPESHCMPQGSEGPGEPSQCDQQQILGAIALKHNLSSALSLQGS